MSDSKSSVKSKILSMLDSDMAAAAQQLIQLSDENNSKCCNSNEDNKGIETQMIKNQSQDDITTSAKIEEIFGEEDEISRKKKRYRSIESIYKETKRVKVGNDKNSWY
ncbi:uncharacterized protein LOC120135876 [Hibiscus syriacus]|uniref:uncharacterized protein LOC120135876 n=1 Tax=Hibiscus syriacus TaxID=106335 RepID=UPI0019232F7A|nr:uncharacterized protein LOC120135876 [Hibiscus syriacus]